MFGRSKPRGLTPAEEAAARRQSHIPEPVDYVPAQPAKAPLRETAAREAVYETKTVKLDLKGGSGFTGPRADRKKLERLLADGWEIVTKNEKKFLEFGHKTIYVLRRPL